MGRTAVLHMVTPEGSISPFDVNMAADAGYSLVIPYTNASVSSIANLVQDAIFSRPPQKASITGMFIGGNDVVAAADMLASARTAMVPPFELSILADPNGAYTTSGALIACIDKLLAEQYGRGMQDRTVKIFGGGPVGICATLLASKLGSRATLVRLTAGAKSGSVQEFSKKYNTDIQTINAVSDEERIEAMSNAEIIIGTAKAGVQVLSNEMLRHASKLLIAADVNAVPPSGLEFVGVTDKGATIDVESKEFMTLGALGIGKVKYDTQYNAFKKMLNSPSSIVFDFFEVFELAVENA